MKCAICGREFEGTKTQRYCSRLCRMEANRRAAKRSRDNAKVLRTDNTLHNAPCKPNGGLQSDKQENLHPKEQKPNMGILERFKSIFKK